jgi:hypothetical protein
MRIATDPDRNFASKSSLCRTEVDYSKPLNTNFIGNIDADISVQPFYSEDLITNFRSDPS